MGSDKTIGRKTRIRWCDDASASCNALNQPDPPSAFEHAHRGAQHLQPSMPSRLAIDAADLQSRDGSAMVRCRRSSVRPASTRRFRPRGPRRISRRGGPARRAGHAAAASRSHEAARVILVVGVNGNGKTTTIAKQYRDAGHKMMLAAGGTFRAAAVEQLQIWCERTGCPVVTRSEGSDSAGLAFDALVEARTPGKAHLGIAP